MSYKIKPKNFSPRHHIVGCIMESNKEIILLKRKNSSIQGNKWGIPSGKVEKKETLLQAIKREIKEETGINVKKNNLKLFKKYEVRHTPGYDFSYYLFHTKFKNKKP